MALSRSICLGASVLTGVMAQPVLAQDAGPTGRLLTLDTTYGLQASDNPDLDTDGNARFDATARFRLGMLTATEGQSFQAALDGGLRLSAGADADTSDLVDPALSFAYERQTRGAALEIDGNLRRSEVSSLSPLDLLLDEDLSDEDLEDLLDGTVSDEATRLTFSLGASLETRRDHPFGVTYSLGVSGVRYSGDNNTFDDDTRLTGGIDMRLDLTETIQATSNLRYVLREDEENETRLNLAIGQRFATSRLGLRLGLTDQATGLRGDLALTGAIDRPTGRLSGEIGVSLEEGGDPGLIGSARAAFDLSDVSAVTFDLSRRVTQIEDANDNPALRTVTALSGTYAQQLTRSWQLGLDTRYVITRSDAAGEGDEDFGQIGASLSRALTRDWALTMGASHRFEKDDDGSDASGTAVSLSLSRSFQQAF